MPKFNLRNSKGISWKIVSEDGRNDKTSKNDKRD